jgi:hypothetical protein
MKRFFRVVLGLPLPAAIGCFGGNHQGPSSGSTSASGGKTGAPTLTGGTQPDPDWTAGPTVSATIDAKGGTLATADQVATLIIPPGALTQPTQVSIQEYAQPLNDGGTRPVLQLSPDGLTFNPPALPLLRYRYSDQDVSVFSPNTLTIETRGDDRDWSSYGVVRELDADAGFIGVELLHFSPQALGGCELITSADGVFTSEWVLTGLHCSSLPQHAPGPQVLWPQRTGHTDVKVAGFVNGIPGGSAAVGTMACDSDVAECTYTAPSIVPSPRKVPISITFQSTDSVHFETYSAAIRIGVTARHWRLVSNWRNHQACDNASVAYVDDSTCTASFLFQDNGLSTVEQISCEAPVTQAPSLCPGNGCSPQDTVVLSPAPRPAAMSSFIAVYDAREDTIHMTINGDYEDQPPLVETLYCNPTATNPIPEDRLPMDNSLDAPPENGWAKDNASYNGNCKLGPDFVLKQLP